MHFEPKPSSSYLFFRLTCNDPATNTWSVVIYDCMPNEKGKYILAGIPTEREKVWTITRTLEVFNLHCNGVLVLNFSYQSSHLVGFPQCHSVWSRESTGVAMLWTDEMYEPGYIYMRIRG